MLAQTIDKITRGWERQGWEKGESEGAARLFMELYAAKYGGVPNAIRERVVAASTGQLEVWAERLLSADSSDDVFND